MLVASVLISHCLGGEPWRRAYRAAGVGLEGAGAVAVAELPDDGDRLEEGEVLLVDDVRDGGLALEEEVKDVHDEGAHEARLDGLAVIRGVHEGRVRAADVAGDGEGVLAAIGDVPVRGDLKVVGDVLSALQAGCVGGAAYGCHVSPPVQSPGWLPT